MPLHTALGPLWVVRDWGEPAASPVTSAAPPKAEVNSEHYRLRGRTVASDLYGRLRVGAGLSASLKSHPEGRAFTLMGFHP